MRSHVDDSPGSAGKRKQPPRPRVRRLDRPLGATRSKFAQRKLAPAELFVGSFLVLVVLGTLGLKLIPGLYTGEPLSWTDAVFTATSAVCVTGLTVVDTATHFTFAGQLLILVLIQIGGLGVLVITSVILAALGARLSLRTEASAAGSRSPIPHVTAGRLIFDIVRFTACIEGLGMLLLYLLWAPRLGWDQAFWPALFHSVSAFCNAGFSTNTPSLIGWRDSPLTIAVISTLIVVGGLGFVTLEELYQRTISRKHRLKRLSVHAHLVLWTSGLLILVGWFFFAMFEWRGTLSNLAAGDKLANALFMSITSRTAGFNTIDYAQASDATNFLTIILMTIGGSPGSTAGGIKTTTFALLGLLAWSRLRSRPTATFAHRSIPEETIQRATGLFVIATAVIVLAVFGLSIIGHTMGGESRFLELMFEAVSAFNTVGLSMGVTPELSFTARWLIILLMLLGRTGPLSIATALTVRLSRSGKYRLAYEDVVVG